MTAWNWAMDGWIIAVGEALSAVSCALLGNFLVLRRMSLMGDAIAHAVLPGLAIAFLLTASRASGVMFIGAAIVGLLTAVLSQMITRFGKVEHGAAMGVVFSVLFAIGLILIRQAADHVDIDPECVLYGNLVTAASFGDPVPLPAYTLGAVSLANLLFVVLLFKELKITSFDPQLATTLGINASVLHYLLMVMVAITAVANFEAVGSILVIAMLIVPAACAHLLTDRLSVMIVLSVVVALLSAVGGHVLALWGPGWVGFPGRYAASSAGMMTVVAGGLFGLAVLFSPGHGVVAKLYHRTALSLQIAREDILGVLFRWQESEADPNASMPRHALLSAVGDNVLARRALGRLQRHRQVRAGTTDAGEPAVQLTDAGRVQATGLIRGHRLWESYLDKHGTLPLDHLHAPAERMEHYLDDDLRRLLDAELADRSVDPHGREIPEPD